jgi:hypothetical protein
MNAMRILSIASTLLVLATVASGQDEETRLSHPITRADILSLPRRDAAPALTLQRALKIAERFAKKQKVDLSSAYLFEAKWVSYATTPETGAWHFWWVSTKHSEPDVRIAVSVDGKPKLLPLPGAT